MSEEDLSALKRRRNTHKGNVTKASRRLSHFKTLKAAELDEKVLTQQISFLTKSSGSFCEIQQSIIDNFEHLINIDEEQASLDQLEMETFSIEGKYRSLISISEASTLITGLKRALENCESSISEDNIASYSNQIERLVEKLDVVQPMLCTPAASQYEGLQATFDELDSKLSKLQASISIAKATSATPPVTPTVEPKRVEPFHVPHLPIPQFHGDPMEWASFWQSFNEAIHSKSTMSEGTKLTYLKSAIKDKAATNLILTASAAPGQYDTIISMLKERYDQRRLIHRKHVESLFGVSLKSSNARELREFYEVIVRHLAGLRASGQDTFEAVATSILVGKLTPQLQEHWRHHTEDDRDVPDVSRLVSFIKTKLSNMTTLSSMETTPVIKSETKRPKAAVYTTGVADSCKVCKGDHHPLYMCNTFRGMSYEKKMATVQSQRLCYNCLRGGHSTKACHSSHKCKVCQRGHHTILHREEKTPVAEPQQPATINVFANQARQKKETQKSLPLTLQMTTQVITQSHSGRQIKARALIDSGASLSLMTQRLSQQLGLTKTKQVTSLVGVQGLSAGDSQCTVACHLKPKDPTEDDLCITAAVVPTVTSNLPLHKVTGAKDWEFLQGLQLADPHFDTPGRIDLILGSDVLGRLMKDGFKQGTDGQPGAFNTIFGWAVTGPYQQHVHHMTTGAECYTITSMDESLRLFWQQEEAAPDATTISLTPEEASVMKHFQETHQYTPKGRYQVTLPRRPNVKPLGESRSLAVQRCLTNERAIERKGIKQQFQQVVQEYLDLDHAEPVPKDELDKPSSEVYYMPMHAVRKASSTTTKLRVVFDASAKTRTGTSLNQTLMVGPTVYPSLVDVLLRFRLYNIALSSDVTKMYREVELAPSDRDLHRFVWRRDSSDELSDYRMKRVTFGVTSSPFMATQVLQQTAIDFGKDFPQAATEVKRSFYVDDCLTGANSTEDAICLCNQLQKLLGKGSFLLRKWRSNSTDVMSSIPSELHEKDAIQLLPGDMEYHKTLGIHWNSTKDQFHVSTSQLKPSGTLTKRSLCSDVARIFDVLGWFAPATVMMKMTFQSLWEENIGWDEKVPEHIWHTWEAWRNQLPMLNNQPINRPYFAKGASRTRTVLHGFADASEKAYAAVIYIRAEYDNHQPTITLVTAKTKVAPLKRLSIPRLELCGALLLAKVVTSTRKALNIEVDNVRTWTDSTVVLNWLSGNPKHFKTFVGNRISDILELVPSSLWSHVPTHDNPADCASRGLLPEELLHHQLWWNGPPWLHKPPDGWPPQPALSSPTKGPEFRATVHLVTTLPEPWLVDRFSCHLRLKRVLGWIMRFTFNCLMKVNRKETRQKATLSFDELRNAEILLLQQAQHRLFEDEFHQLSDNDSLKNNSTLLSLRPFVDSRRLLRVGGRLGKAPFKFNKRHPIILHAKDRLTRLMMKRMHITSLHAGPTMMLSLAGRDYHIVGAKQLVRSICRQCVTCRKRSAKPQSQLMGQLPPERTTPGNVFNVVGVDFAGPILTKYAHVRKPVIMKSYACIFVSFSVKAVHLEPVTDLTTEAFLAAFKRFIARRGKPAEVFSDNGTNFIGASREISSMYQLLSKTSSQDTITDYASSHGIRWRFSPERSPHFGGMWEAAVKSMKMHLRKCMGDSKYTFEELTTMLCQIESCLNSRLLCPNNKHDDDGIECLTPGHFLVGKPLEALPNVDTCHTNTSLRRRWNLCQSATQMFWARWSADYISAMRQYTKLMKPSRNLEVGDLVLVKEDSPFITRWPLARVIATHPGTDERVRVATVSTAQGTCKRPVMKLSLLLDGD